MEIERKRQLAEQKPIHIKRTQREVLQLFRNFYIFYDKVIEEKLKEGEDMITYVVGKLEQCFTGHRVPKIILDFIKAVKQIDQITGVKHDDFHMNKIDFIKYFGSEHIQGTIHMFTKKLLDGVKQVPVDFNLMPCDHLYPITDKIYTKNNGLLHSSQNDQYDRRMPGTQSYHSHVENKKRLFKETFNDSIRKKVKEQIEKQTLGITIGYKMEGAVEMILEVPLEKEKTFIIMNSLQMQEDGVQTYIRKILEIVGGKKLRNMLHQKYLVRRVHPDCAIKPHFVPVGNDILAHKRARIVNYLDDQILEDDENSRIDILKSQSEAYLAEEANSKIDQKILQKVSTKSHIKSTFEIDGLDGLSMRDDVEFGSAGRNITHLGSGLADATSRNRQHSQLSIENQGSRRNKDFGATDSLDDDWEMQDKMKEKEEDLGSEYRRLMNEIGQPPKSLRRNAPLNNHQEKLPKWFDRDF